MGRKGRRSEIDKAIERGDWTELVFKSASELRESNKQINPDVRRDHIELCKLLYRVGDAIAATASIGASPDNVTYSFDQNQACMFSELYGGPGELRYKAWLEGWQDVFENDQWRYEHRGWVQRLYLDDGRSLTLGHASGTMACQILHKPALNRRTDRL
jgi:hypothetical protein